MKYSVCSIDDVGLYHEWEADTLEEMAELMPEGILGPIPVEDEHEFTAGWLWRKDYASPALWRST